MPPMNRKSAPKVVEGNVQKKNNWQLSTDYYDAPHPRMVVVDRKRPGEGYRHVLNKSDIYTFLELLPDWDKLAVGLNAIVLDTKRSGCFGYHVPGVVHFCAWDARLWTSYPTWLYKRDRAIMERLGVECETYSDYLDRQLEADIPHTEIKEAFAWADCPFLCKWTENQARGFLLLDVLLHELGHHRDRMTTRSQRRAARGEKYAEDYALQYEAQIWQRYLKVFAL